MTENELSPVDWIDSAISDLEARLREVCADEGITIESQSFGGDRGRKLIVSSQTLRDALGPMGYTVTEGDKRVEPFYYMMVYKKKDGWGIVEQVDIGYGNPELKRGLAGAFGVEPVYYTNTRYKLDRDMYSCYFRRTHQVSEQDFMSLVDKNDIRVLTAFSFLFSKIPSLSPVTVQYLRSMETGR
ncbi:MAG: hypothetical protein ABIC95_02760 [archaeon]